MKNTLNKFRNYFPLTFRGIIVSGLVYFCLIFLGSSKSDLVASVIGALLLISLFTFLSIIIPSAFIIKRRLKLENLGSPEKSISKTEGQIILSLSNFKVPPLFILKIERVFNASFGEYLPSSIKTKSLLCTGSFIPSQNIMNSITFPHRGNFEQRYYNIELSDYFGLTKISWQVTSTLSYAVYPAERTIEPLPLLLASSVSGDLTSATDIRSGDLFDTKQYYPGDSLKRILWKVYARSEELIVRHPEAAIIPEGELVAYTIAFAEHDNVASATLSYLKLVDSQNITFLAGSYGDGGKVATSLQEAEGNCLSYPLNPSSQKAITEFDIFMNTLISNNHHPVEIILFAPDDNNAQTKRSGITQIILNDLKSHARTLGLKVHLALVEPFEPIEKNKNTWGNTNFDNDTHKVKFL